MKQIVLALLFVLSSLLLAAQGGIHGNSLNFTGGTGGNSYVAISENLDNGITEYTIEAWVKWSPTNTNDVEFICAKNFENMELHTGGGAGPNGIRFIPTNGVWLDAYNVLPVNVWTHIAAVYKPSISLAKMYINGLEVPLISNGPNSVSTQVATSSAWFRLGRRQDGNYHFKGEIDELRVWNKVRTQSEIYAEMRKALDVSQQTGLLAYFDFNVGSSGGNNSGLTTLPDLTGNFPGTLYYFTLTGLSSNWVEGVTTFNVVPVKIITGLFVFILIAFFVFMRKRFIF